MNSLQRKRVVIVSPALADANNGNWQTARRWQRMLSGAHSARITREWPGHVADNAAADHVMLALHARRSAPSIAAWAAARASQPRHAAPASQCLRGARAGSNGGTDAGACSPGSAEGVKRGGFMGQHAPAPPNICKVELTDNSIHKY